MEKKRYRLRANTGLEVEAQKEFKYSRCHDGIVVYEGTLPGSGFQPYHCKGITLPEEIDGIPVTELRGTFKDDEIGYIEAPCLKRIVISIENQNEMSCEPPLICGGSQFTLERVELCFIAPKMHLSCFSESFSEKVLTKIVFNGDVVDDTDWDYCHFKRGIFKDCAKLQRVSGSFNGWCLDGSTFEGCKSLISIPDIRVNYISDYEFKDCLSLSSIHLHNGLKGIGSGTFENCQSLKDIYIPDTVTRFGIHTFRGCENLETIHLPKEITKINNEMFLGCFKLKKVFLSDEIETIGDSAFEGCKTLQNPWMPQKLRSIGDRAFWGCESITQVIIPETVEKIGDSAFGECPNLIIKGYRNSAAEKHAMKYNIPFIEL